MIFKYLFQPDKSALSPIGRAFIAWLEIVLIALPVAGAGAGLDYLNGHPNDFSGMIPFIISAMVVALMKAFTTLGVSLKNTGVIATDSLPLPPTQETRVPAQAGPPSVTITNNMPAAPEPRLIQLTAPPATQTGAPLPATQFKVPVPGVTESATASMPALPVQRAQIRPDERDWTGLEIPAAPRNLI